jgi:glutathione S-transferase
MMILRGSGASPFVRKVRIVAALLGLQDKMTMELADTTNPTDSLRKQNPLGKVPTLVLDDGTTLFDSAVIVDYLDYLAGDGVVVPREPKARFVALRLQALCDGLLDASLLQVYEGRFRAEDRREPKWIAYQAEKVTRTLDVLESDPPKLTPRPDVGQIALACALGYQDLRFEGTWRKSYPRLVAWLDDFAARVPAFAETKPAG